MPLAASKPYAIEGELLLTPQDGRPTAFALAPQDDDTLVAQIRPSQAVTTTLQARLWATGPGDRIELPQGELGQLAVEPRQTQVGIVVLAPHSHQVGRDLWNRPTPFVVDVQMVDGKGQPLDGAAVFARSTEAPFRARVTRVEDGNTELTTLALRPTGEPGRFRAADEVGAALGRYAVHVRATAPLKPGYVLAQEDVRMVAARVDHPLWALAPLLAVLIVGLSASRTLGWMADRIGPRLRGTLSFRDFDLALRY